MKGDQDGLDSRFLYIYPNPVPRHRPHNLADDNLMARTLRRLHALKMDEYNDHNAVSRVIGLTGDASGTFEHWWREQQKNAPEGKSGGWHAKLPSIALGLSLVLTYFEFLLPPALPQCFRVLPYRSPDEYTTKLDKEKAR
jgi:hypothetical protein